MFVYAIRYFYENNHHYDDGLLFSNYNAAIKKRERIINSGVLKVLGISKIEIIPRRVHENLPKKG